MEALGDGLIPIYALWVGQNILIHLLLQRIQCRWFQEGFLSKEEEVGSQAGIEGPNRELTGSQWILREFCVKVQQLPELAQSSPAMAPSQRCHYLLV